MLKTVDTIEQNTFLQYKVKDPLNYKIKFTQKISYYPKNLEDNQKYLDWFYKGNIESLHIFLNLFNNHFIDKNTKVKYYDLIYTKIFNINIMIKNL